MIDIESKFDTCFVEKIKYLTNLDKAYFIWHQWSFYNLFYKSRHINQKLYDNFKPHALYGNYNWNKTFNIFLKLKKFNLNWSNITHKEIYLKLKELSSKKTEIISLNKKVIPWNKIICNTGNKKFKYKINNKERETIYRTAHNAFKWQQNNICKFCGKSINTIEHILIYCEPIKSIWQEYEKLVLKNKNIQIKLNKDNITHSHTHTSHTFTHIQTHLHTLTHTHTHSHTHSHIHSHTITHTLTHTLTRTHNHTHKLT